MMNYKFEIYIREHIDEMLCQAEKEQVLSGLRKSHNHRHEGKHVQPAHRSAVQEIQIQDCAVAPSFSRISL